LYFAEFSKPGTYEFKYIINGQWKYDHMQFANDRTNNEITIPAEAQKKIIYKDLTYIRKWFNLHGRKVTEKYPRVAL